MNFLELFKRKGVSNVAPAAIFTIDDAVSAMDKKELFDYLYCTWANKFYEPPISFDGLAKSFYCNAHHSSAIFVKRNILLSTFIPSVLISRSTFEQIALDFLIFGNCYLELLKNRLGKSIGTKPLKARWMRVGKKNDFYLRYNSKETIVEHVVHLKAHDFNQEIYGMPEYLSAMNSAWLNEAATLFRRKYYLNGSHAGFILHITEDLNTDDYENLKKQLKSAKGIGNFKNLVLHSPSGKTGGVELIPISQVTAKDEFFNIKTLTRDDVLAAHRVPPQLMSVVPTNTAGFGDAAVASKVFVKNELEPLQARFLELNELIGQRVIDFAKYTIE